MIYKANLSKITTNKGFTLAEVLITLAIIGVVASISIPSLITSYNDSQFKTGMKKNFSVISNALKMYRAENGTFLIECTDGDCLKNTLKKYFSLIKNCSNAKRYDCMYDFSAAKIIKTLHGSLMPATAIHNSPLQIEDKGSSFMLSDGTSMIFTYRDDSPPAMDYDYTSGYKIGGISYGAITFDLNGDKGPNTFGKDIYSVILTTEGVKAVKTFPCDKSSTSMYNGIGCSGKYMMQ